MNKEQALIELKKAEENILELRKIISAPDKPTPAERFWQLCEGLAIKIDREKFPHAIFFFKNDELQFEYNTKNGHLWCRYSSIWSVFEEEDGMKYNEIQSLIKTQVEEYFKCKGVTPSLARCSDSAR